MLKCIMKLNWAGVRNVIGELVLAYYTAILQACLEPVVCFKSPNGKWAISSMPEVECDYYSGVHLNMMLMSFVALCTLPIAAIVWFAYSVWKVRSLGHDDEADMDSEEKRKSVVDMFTCRY